MKKNVVWMIISILLLLSMKQVYAKDTVYSLNKYNEEEYKYILKSYDAKKNDGYIVAGTYKENDEDETKVLLIKYSLNGNIVWEYMKEQQQDNDIYGLAYTYDEENQIDGYLLVTAEKTDIGETSKWIKINLAGEQVSEQFISLETNSKIEKLLLIENENYVLAGEKNNNAFLTKYNKEQEKIWEKEVAENASIVDLIYKENIGFYGIVKIKKEIPQYKLVKYDLEGNEEKTIKEDFESIDVPHLEMGIQSFILYGYTQEVKLSNDKYGSYYIVKYNFQEEEEWETLGNTPVNQNKKIQIQTIMEENQEKEYCVLSTNISDNSIEIVKVDKDGMVHNKIKKIKNDYYDINGFIIEKNSIYFVGQINCPEDDNCDYDKNSLLLISDEDKVIEVKDNDSKTILIAVAIFIGMIFIIYQKNKYQRLMTSKKEH